MGNEARQLSPRAFSISHHGAGDEKGEFRPSSLQSPQKPPKQHSLMVPTFLLVTAGPCTPGRLKALKMLLSLKANNPEGISKEHRVKDPGGNYLDGDSGLRSHVSRREGLCIAEPWQCHPGNSCSTAMCSSPSYRHFYRRWQLSYRTVHTPWEARSSWSTTEGLWCQYQFSRPWAVSSPKKGNKEPIITWKMFTLSQTQENVNQSNSGLSICIY